MINKNHSLYSFKPSPVGGIGYRLILSNAEIAMLKLLLAPDEKSFPYWQNYWHEICDYEDSPFGCKELMPLAVRKMQRATDSSLWQSVAPKQATFLSGLPKYTWTKNRIIFQQFQFLCTKLTNLGVSVMAIKGMAEMLRDPEVMFMRTSRDIDLVIQPKDLAISIELFHSLGWRTDQLTQGIPSPLSDFDGNSFTFDHPDHFISLDIHFDAISDSRGGYMEFTQELWDTCNILPGYQGLLSIPSMQNQFCLFLANAFVPDNWSTGLVNKYLYDLLRQIQDMTPVAKKEAQERAQRYLKMGDYAQQIFYLSDRIDPNSGVAGNPCAYAIRTRCRLMSQGLRVSEDRYYQYWHTHNYYADLWPKLIRQYGKTFAMLWVTAHYCFNLRVTQVCYWHFITWKDQLIERIRYYQRRIMLVCTNHSIIEIAKIFVLKITKKVGIGNNSKLNIAASSEFSAKPSTAVSAQELVNESDNGSEIQSIISVFPPGMSRFFYLSFKLLKI